MTILLKCGKCREQRNTDTFICCVEYNRVQPYGKALSGITKNTGAKKQDCERCRICQSDSHSSTEYEIASKIDVISALSSKVEELLPLHSAISSLAAKVDVLLTLKNTVDSLHQSVGRMKSSMTSFSEKYDEVVVTTDKQETATRQLQAEKDTMKSRVQEQFQEVLQLLNEINEQERYSRLANLEIHRLPVEENGDLLQVLQQLTEKLEIDFDSKEVVAAHRLPSRRNASPPVLIKFSSSVVKERWMNCRGKLMALAERPRAILAIFQWERDSLPQESVQGGTGERQRKSLQNCMREKWQNLGKEHEEAPLVHIKANHLDLIT